MAKIGSTHIEMLDSVLAHCFSGHNCHAHGQDFVLCLIISVGVLCWVRGRGKKTDITFAAGCKLRT